MNYIKELAADANELWDKVCNTKHPGFWGYLVGWCGTAGIVYLIMYLAAIFTRSQWTLEKRD